jgi:hypothetical protein
MSFRLKPRALSLLLAPLIMTCSRNALADFYFHTWDDYHENEGSFRLDGNLLFYNTSSNYDPDKVAFTPSGLTNYSRTEVDLIGVYGVNPWLTLYGRGSWARVSVNSTSPSTGYGFGDQTLGANARFWQDRTKGLMADAQLQIDFPGYSNSTAATNHTSYLGDGSTDITAGAFLTYIINHQARTQDELKVVGGLGYTLRTLSFSAAIPYSIDLEYTRGRDGFYGSVGFAGTVSRMTDSREYGTTNAYAIEQSAGGGGSFVINAIDPSLVNIRGTLGYRTSKDLAFYLTGMKPISGQQAPDGTTIIAGVTMHFGASAATPPPPRQRANPNREVREDSDQPAQPAQPAQRTPQQPQAKAVNPALQEPAEYGKSNQGFVDYGLEANVTATNDRLNLVRINKGSNDGVEPGDVFDFFPKSDNPAGGSAVARGRVTSVKPSETAIKIIEYYKEVWIQEGAIARRPVK